MKNEAMKYFIELGALLFVVALTTALHHLVGFERMVLVLLAVIWTKLLMKP